MSQISMGNVGSAVEYEVTQGVELDHLVRIIYTTLRKNRQL